MLNNFFNNINKNQLINELIILRERLKKNKLSKEASDIKVSIEAKTENELILFLGHSGKKTLEIAKIDGLLVAVKALNKAIKIQD